VPRPRAIFPTTPPRPPPPPATPAPTPPSHHPPPPPPSRSVPGSADSGSYYQTYSTALHTTLLVDTVCLRSNGLPLPPKVAEVLGVCRLRLYLDAVITKPRRSHGSGAHQPPAGRRHFGRTLPAMPARLPCCDHRSVSIPQRRNRPAPPF
jgi:hypothetical protein